MRDLPTLERQAIYASAARFMIPLPDPFEGAGLPCFWPRCLRTGCSFRIRSPAWREGSALPTARQASAVTEDGRSVPFRHDSWRGIGSRATLKIWVHSRFRCSWAGANDRPETDNLPRAKKPEAGAACDGNMIYGKRSRNGQARIVHPSAPLFGVQKELLVTPIHAEYEKEPKYAPIDNESRIMKLGISMSKPIARDVTAHMVRIIRVSRAVLSSAHFAMSAWIPETPVRYCACKVLIRSS